MQIPSKTLKNGFSMPAFGLGTWHMGGDFHRDPENDDAADIRAIQGAIDAGITHIDTAEMYAEGHSEELVGEAIAAYDRSSLFLVSKVSPWNHGEHNLSRSLDASLKRLRTGYLDLYLLHKPNPEIPLEETMGAMDRAAESGKIRAIGISNFTKERMRKAQSVTKHHIMATQVHLNLKIRDPLLSGLHQACTEDDVLLIAWRPVQGVLEGEGRVFLEPLCEKYQKTPAQIAINWLLQKPNVVTLAKMSAKAHLQDNLGALGWQLSPADSALLDTAFPGQEKESDAVPLL